MIPTIAASLLLATAGITPASGHTAMAHRDTVSGPTNTICPVLGNPVTPGKSTIVKVRGREYYLCCPGCKAKLEAHPDQYLEKDGTPKNARK